MNQRTTILIETEMKDDGTVSVRNGYVYTPVIKSAGLKMKWYEDTYKEREQK